MFSLGNIALEVDLLHRAPGHLPVCQLNLVTIQNYCWNHSEHLGCESLSLTFLEITEEK